MGGWQNSLEVVENINTEGTFFSGPELNTSLSGGRGTAHRDDERMSASVTMDTLPFEMMTFDGDGILTFSGAPVISASAHSSDLWELAPGTEFELSVLAQMSGQVDASHVQELTQGKIFRIHAEGFAIHQNHQG